MSFDLMVFDKSKAPGFYEDFLNWSSERTQWNEERDYDSLQGTTPQLTAWFMEMKEDYPPMNGPYSPDGDAIDADEALERRLTDYSIGSDVIYTAFAWSVAEEACGRMAELAKKHGVGFYDFQSANIVCEGMVVCKMTTERHDEKPATWEQIEREVLSLDDPETAFVTMWFERDETGFKKNGTDGEFMQCFPNYPKPEGFIKRLFSPSKNGEKRIASYTVEASTGEKIFTLQVDDKETVARLLRDYYRHRRLPDTSGWEDSGII